ncbi:hypothetical protein DFH06DRAFT_276345 [Mycena polygramma]|nr:hypothetical protein DFH06DRAFT_276345 [Mycena polygramma]
MGIFGQVWQLYIVVQVLTCLSSDNAANEAPEVEGGGRQRGVGDFVPGNTYVNKHPIRGDSRGKGEEQESQPASTLTCCGVVKISRRRKTERSRRARNTTSEAIPPVISIAPQTKDKCQRAAAHACSSTARRGFVPLRVE